MPATDSPAILVARFLKANNYDLTYDAFISEAGLPADAGTVSKGDLTLETICEEKRTFDLSVQFEKLGTGDKTGWSLPAPSKPETISTLPTKSNILHASVDRLVLDGETTDIMLSTTADRRLNVLNPESRDLKSSWIGLQDSPILHCIAFQKKFLLLSSMSGQLIMTDSEGHIVDKRRDHSKYVVKIAVSDSMDKTLVATAGWDNKIRIYEPTISSESERPTVIGEPVATIALPTKPESIIFLKHPETGEPILLVSRTDSSHIHYYTTTSPTRLLGRQNLAPHSNAWVAFTPSALALSPTDSSLLAVATSSVPYLKLLMVRLLIPPFDESEPRNQNVRIRASLLDDATGAHETQASQARAALVIADREHAAIQVHVSTLAPQTPYSTPAVAWRPDGTGVWVNGDDGVIRGVEAHTGKIVSSLKGHEVGSKVRCLWAGWIGEGKQTQEEWVISGGFDQQLIVWRPEKTV